MKIGDYLVLEYMWEFLACFFVKVPFMLTFWLCIWVVLFRMLLFMSLLVQYKENSIYTHTCDFQGQYCFSCRRGIFFVYCLVQASVGSLQFYTNIGYVVWHFRVLILFNNIRFSSAAVSFGSIAVDVWLYCVFCKGKVFWNG